MAAIQRSARPTPPDKGSFPLDHGGICKEGMLSLLACLKETNGQSHKCRQLSKSYLECRMDKDLMAKEDLAGLGFTGELIVNLKEVTKPRKEATGFVSGLTGGKLTT